MAISEARRAANKKWNDENMKDRYDRIQIVVLKGNKAVLQAHAKNRGETLSGFINRAIEETVKRDGGGK